MNQGFAVRFAVVSTVLLMGLAIGASASFAGERPAQKQPPIMWIDLSGTAEVQPRFIFFSANAGSQVRNVTWSKWGRNRTVGRGRYVITSPPPPNRPNPKGPARIVAWKPIKCVPEFGSHKGKTLRVYRHAKLLRPVPNGGRKWTDISAFTGYLTCK